MAQQSTRRRRKLAHRSRNGVDVTLLWMPGGENKVVRDLATVDENGRLAA